MHTGKTSPRRFADTAQSGFTLIEIMIALTISVALLTVLSLVFVGNNGFRQDVDRASRLVENSSYSMERLVDDFRLAGYYAQFDIVAAMSLPGGLTVPTAKPDACATDLPSLMAATPIAIQGYDGGSTSTSLPTLPASCSAITDLRPKSDVVLVRHVEPCVPGQTDSRGNVCASVKAGVPYFQAAQCTPKTTALELKSPLLSEWYRLDTNTANLDRRMIDCNVAPPGTLADYHRFLVDIYFVSNNDNAGDGIPTLKLAQLDATAGATAFTVVPLAEGIESLQVEYGLDTNADGVPDAYTADPDNFVNAGGCPGTAAACMTNWLNTMTAKVRLLGRTTEPSATGQTDTKTYTLGLLADSVTANTFGPFGDKFKRRVYAGTVRIYNPAGRR
jgi:type IV pilus assembly protein PilW